MAARESIYVKEVAEHQARYERFVSFTSSSMKGAIVMIVAAAVAMILANSPAGSSVESLFATEIGFSFGGQIASLSLLSFVNDVLMAIFFLLIGLDIKHEVISGDLSNPRQALLPIVAACGGVLCPALIYVAFNAGSPPTMAGWGVPTATDIAFAIGILSLLGSRVPHGIAVFLSTLAVADDIIAILVIAVFYGHSPSMAWLVGATALFVLLLILNRLQVYALAPYLIVGVGLWCCMFMSGVHPTIAGVLLAFTIPSGTRIDLSVFASWVGGKIKQADKLFSPIEEPLGQKEYLGTVKDIGAVARQVVPPATRLSNMLFPWVFFGILPLFAFANAGVRFTGDGFGVFFTNPAFLGVFFGLVIGKPIGITVASLLIVKTKIASLPDGARWPHVVGAGILGGIGFTMAIFVANLAYSSPELISDAKIGIVAASVLAATVGFVFLSIYARIRPVEQEASGVKSQQDAGEKKTHQNFHDASISQDESDKYL